MSRARHKKSGGAANPPVTTAYAGGNSNVAKEAQERKFGGAVKNLKAEGAKAKHKLGRPGRKRGGRIGADMAPLSSAAKVSHTAER